ncbi:glutathione S-transferase family protein [Mariluticola halotolerans]|uniref:glutathione S-transferase family protein n=1 Tax=Mariluticola halotolerans TaxID=2909283 RepID=UPI0026E38E86|nr:glutathione S-transferase family protein [Mariluticola halotolerans]UJQ93288.1 glutathione S-transferase family protein [Mariluticola halotolerans]
MTKLLHHKLDPASRMVRLMLAEYGAEIELEDASPWLRPASLTDLNPAATVPLLLEHGMAPIIGPLAVVHFVEERYTPDMVAGLVPADIGGRAEMWRLYDWVMGKFNDEVTRYILEEKIGRREQKAGAPDPSALRAAKANLAEHLQYFAYLFATRRWLGGDAMTLADFALAGHLSALDYLGDIDWAATGETRDWYARIKSRPAFRPLLGDRLVGTTPSKSYADLDF